jgi:antitoxin HicB
MRYPVTITPDDNGTFLVTFPDVPEAITFGDTREDALARAPEALLTIFDALMKDRRPIPQPSVITRPWIELPALDTAKIELYRAMYAQRIGKAELARRLHWHGPQVDRVLDVHHESRLDQMEAAFAAVGKHLRVTVEDATPVARTASTSTATRKRGGQAARAGAWEGGATSASGSRAGARSVRSKKAAKKR